MHKLSSASLIILSWYSPKRRGVAKLGLCEPRGHIALCPAGQPGYTWRGGHRGGSSGPLPDASALPLEHMPSCTALGGSLSPCKGPWPGGEATVVLAANLEPVWTTLLLSWVLFFTVLQGGGLCNPAVMEQSSHTGPFSRSRLSG